MSNHIGEINKMVASPPLPAPAGSANLPCPFCGWPCDDCVSEDGDEYLGCSNDKCAAAKLAWTGEQWNRRPLPPNTERTDRRGGGSVA